MGDGCKHLNNFKVAKGIQPYEAIFSFFVACISDEARKTKVIYLFIGCGESLYK